jgi:tetraacyldisaccharide 4'-kinase
MRAKVKLEQWLNAQWYGRKNPPWALRAVVPIYRALWALAALPYALGLRKAKRASKPLWVVGNVTVGGSGKTPVVIALVQRALGAGLRPGVISRGYGGTHQVPSMVQSDTDWRICGDEPWLIHHRTSVPVAVARKRLDAAALIADQCDVLICDDGLQHRALARDLEILVIDGARRFGNGHLLPAGPLREYPAPGRFIARICNGGTPEVGDFAMQLRGDQLQSINGAHMPLAHFNGHRVHALAGIGNPERFYAQLRAAGLQLNIVPVGDHGVLSAQALTALAAKAIVMTEKDALKYRALPPPLRDIIWFLPVSAELPEQLWQSLMQASNFRRD